MEFIAAFWFLSIQENVYMIPNNLNLFYYIYNAIAKQNQRQNYYISLIPNYFDIYVIAF